ncbi:MAG: hypothetical protein AAFZ52_11050, partial [Bacteroidota bacterium]
MNIRFLYLTFLFCVGAMEISAQSDSLYQLGKSLYGQQQFITAAEHFAAARRAAAEVADKELIRKCLGNEGTARINGGDPHGASRALRQAVLLGEEMLDANDQRLLRYRSNLASALIQGKRYEEGTTLLRQLEKNLESAIEAGQPYTGFLGGVRNNLAVAYMEMGAYERAERQFLTLLIDFASDDHYGRGLVHYNLGDVHRLPENIKPQRIAFFNVCPGSSRFTVVKQGLLVAVRQTVDVPE